MGLIHERCDESKGQKDLNLTQETIKVYNQIAECLCIFIIHYKELCYETYTPRDRTIQ